MDSENLSSLIQLSVSDGQKTDSSKVVSVIAIEMPSKKIRDSFSFAGYIGDVCFPGKIKGEVHTKHTDELSQTISGVLKSPFNMMFGSAASLKKMENECSGSEKDSNGKTEDKMEDDTTLVESQNITESNGKLEDNTVEPLTFDEVEFDKEGNKMDIQVDIDDKDNNDREGPNNKVDIDDKHNNDKEWSDNKADIDDKDSNDGELPDNNVDIDDDKNDREGPSNKVDSDDKDNNVREQSNVKVDIDVKDNNDREWSDIKVDIDVKDNNDRECSDNKVDIDVKDNNDRECSDNKVDIDDKDSNDRGRQNIKVDIDDGDNNDDEHNDDGEWPEDREKQEDKISGMEETEKEYTEFELTKWKEFGVRNSLERLPDGWIQSTHHSGMPIYLHRTSRVCTVTRPYCLGPASLRAHSIPITSIPCLQYRREKEKTMTETGVKNRDIEETNENPKADTGGAKWSAPVFEFKTVDAIEKEHSVEPKKVREYCQQLFEYETCTVKSFKTWKAKRDHVASVKEEERRRRFSLPPATKVITSLNPGPAWRNDGFVINPNSKTPVAILQEYVQHVWKSQPAYRIKMLELAGIPYRSCTVEINGKEYGSGVGAGQKGAKQAAAKKTLEMLLPDLQLFNKDESSEVANEEFYKFFDGVPIEDRRIFDLLCKTPLPLPTTLLMECVTGNYAASEGLKDTSFVFDLKWISKSVCRYTTKVGPHTVTGECRTKKEGRQFGAQDLLKILHPNLDSFGAILRLYSEKAAKNHGKREKWIDDKPSHKLSKADRQPSTDEQPPNPSLDDRQPLADTIDQGNKEKNLKPDKSQQDHEANTEKQREAEPEQESCDSQTNKEIEQAQGGQGNSQTNRDAQQAQGGLGNSQTNRGRGAYQARGGRGNSHTNRGRGAYQAQGGRGRGHFSNRGGNINSHFVSSSNDRQFSRQGSRPQDRSSRDTSYRGRRERSRSHDRNRRNRSRSLDRNRRENSLDIDRRKRSRSQDRDRRDRTRSWDRDRGERSRDRNRGDRSKDRDRGWGSRSQDRDRSRSRDRDRIERSWDRDRGEGSRSHDRDRRERSQDRYRGERSEDRDRRDRSRSQDRDRYRDDWSRSHARDRETEKTQSKQRDSEAVISNEEIANQLKKLQRATEELQKMRQEVLVANQMPGQEQSVPQHNQFPNMDMQRNRGKLSEMGTISSHRDLQISGGPAGLGASHGLLPDLVPPITPPKHSLTPGSQRQQKKFMSDEEQERLTSAGGGNQMHMTENQVWSPVTRQQTSYNYSETGNYSGRNNHKELENRCHTEQFSHVMDQDYADNRQNPVELFDRGTHFRQNRDLSHNKGIDLRQNLNDSYKRGMELRGNPGKDFRQTQSDSLDSGKDIRHEQANLFDRDREDLQNPDALIGQNMDYNDTADGSFNSKLDSEHMSTNSNGRGIRGRGRGHRYTPDNLMYKGTDFQRNFGSQAQTLGRNLNQDDSLYRNVGIQGQSFGGNMGNQEHAFGGNMGNQGQAFGGNLGNQEQAFGRNLGNQGQAFGRNMGNQEQAFGRNLGNQGQAFGRNMGNQGQTFGRNVGNQRQTFPH